jgi:hypothetical protein
MSEETSKNKIVVLVCDSAAPDQWTEIDSFSEFADAEKCVRAMLKEHNWAKLFCGVPNKAHKDIELYYGAFTDPIRGRIEFGGTCQEAQVVDLKHVERVKCQAPVLSPNELYALKPVSVSFDDGWTILERWLKDYLQGMNTFDIVYEEISKSKRLERRTLAHVGLGSEESWSLDTLWFDGKPFAVAQHSGDDDNECFITDSSALHDLVDWVRSLVRDKETIRVVDPAVPDFRLTEFGRYQLTSYYDVVEQREIKCPACDGYKNAPLGVGPDVTWPKSS